MVVENLFAVIREIMIKIQDIIHLLACPQCHGNIRQKENMEFVCEKCCLEYSPTNGIPDFSYQKIDYSSPLWKTWLQLQDNGVKSYINDPSNNLSVGVRPECIKFMDFCQFNGLVLDVGCGPQSWPAYFSIDQNVEYIGVDPIIVDPSEKYLKIKSLAEHLPFQKRSFNNVIFATSLDHIVNPVDALIEAKRVCKEGGSINIWIGEKDDNAPKPSVTNEWYRVLKKPELSEDLFHIKRLFYSDLLNIINEAGLSIYNHKCIPIDEFRRNHFIKINIG